MKLMLRSTEKKSSSRFCQLSHQLAGNSTRGFFVTEGSFGNNVASNRHHIHFCPISDADIERVFSLWVEIAQNRPIQFLRQFIDTNRFPSRSNNSESTLEARSLERANEIIVRTIK